MSICNNSQLIEFSFSFFRCFRKNFCYEELEMMNEDEWTEFMAITDDQAVHSDIGGDSDADDYLDDILSNTNNLSTRSCNQLVSSASNAPDGSLAPQIPSPPPAFQIFPPPTTVPLHSANSYEKNFLPLELSCLQESFSHLTNSLLIEIWL